MSIKIPHRNRWIRLSATTERIDTQTYRQCGNVIQTSLCVESGGQNSVVRSQATEAAAAAALPAVGALLRHAGILDRSVGARLSAHILVSSGDIGALATRAMRPRWTLVYDAAP